MSDERESSRVGQPEVNKVRLDESEAVRRRRSGDLGSRTIEHRGIQIHTRHPIPGLGERDGQAAAPDSEFQDRTIRPTGQGQIQVQVARVIGQVKVVQTSQGSRSVGVGSVHGRLVDGLALPADAMAVATTDGKRADRLQRRPICGHRRGLRLIVRR